jgi:hypothetical protein
MTLREMSALYRASALRLEAKLLHLEALARLEADPAAAQALRIRAEALAPLEREMRELAVLTARYYERGYRRNARYTL